MISIINNTPSSVKDKADSIQGFVNSNITKNILQTALFIEAIRILEYLVMW